MWTSGNTTILNSAIIGNSIASGGSGSAAQLYGTSTMINDTVANNSTGRGAGINAAYGSLNISECTITDPVYVGDAAAARVLP